MDSYEDEGYDRYGHPLMARRKQPSASLSWGSNHERQPTTGGGHSSSSREVSPWEEEPRRREHWEARERKDWQAAQPPRNSRQSSFDRQQRPRRHADSWDEEDDYEQVETFFYTVAVSSFKFYCAFEICNPSNSKDSFLSLAIVFIVADTTRNVQAGTTGPNATARATSKRTEVEVETGIG